MVKWTVKFSRYYLLKGGQANPANPPVHVSVSFRLPSGLTPWKIATAMATGGAIENPSDLMTTLINVQSFILLNDQGSEVWHV